VGFGAGELEKRGALERGNCKQFQNECTVFPVHFLTHWIVEYTNDERTKWSRDPQSYHAYRRQIEDGIMAYMAEDGFKYGSDIQTNMEADFRATMKRKLASRPDILKTLLPDFPPGCRRLVPGPGYLDAVVKDNVQWIPEGIDRVVENGIVTSDGVLHECDAIIWATGFIWLVPRSVSHF
jgi:cation diffusion facilitator CzcD-associated flavoprotein CzcO